MPKKISFNNAAFRGVQAQQGEILAPEEGEVFSTGGGAGKAGQVLYVKGGKVKSVDLAKLGSSQIQQYKAPLDYLQRMNSSSGDYIGANASSNENQQALRSGLKSATGNDEFYNYLTSSNQHNVGNRALKDVYGSWVQQTKGVNPNAQDGNALIQLGINQLKNQGIDASKLSQYNVADAAHWGYGQTDFNGDVGEFSQLYNSRAQTPTDFGAQTSIKGVGPGAANFQEAAALGTDITSDPNAISTAQQQAKDQGTAMQAGSDQAFIQGAAPTQSATVNQAIMPQGSTSQGYEQQAQEPGVYNAATNQAPQEGSTYQQPGQPENYGMLAGKATVASGDVNALFQKYLGRAANQQEIKYWNGKSAQQFESDLAKTRADIIGRTSQQVQQTQDLKAQGFQQIANQADLAQLQATVGFDPSKIVRVGTQMFAPANFSVGDSSVIDKSNLDGTGSDLSKFPYATGNKTTDIALAVVDDYEKQFTDQLSGMGTGMTGSADDFLKARAMYWMGVTGFNAEAAYRDMQKNYEYGGKTPEQLSADLAKLDQTYITRSQAWDTALEDVANTPIALEAITGRQQHMMMLKNIELQGLNASKEALMGQYDRAEKQIDTIMNLKIQDNQQKVTMLKDFYETAKDSFNKAQDRAWQVKIKEAENKFEMEKFNLSNLASLMKEYPTAGISMNDSYDMAIKKASLVPPKGDFSAIADPSGYGGIVIYDQKTGKVVSSYGGIGNLNSGNNNTGPTSSVNLPKEPIITATIGGRKVSGQATFTNDLARADAEMKAAGLGGLIINESLRDSGRQADLYAAFQNGTGGRAAAPGSSWHEKGLAVDVANWQEAIPFLKKYGIVGGLAGDANHFSRGEMNPEFYKQRSDPAHNPNMPVPTKSLPILPKNLNDTVMNEKNRFSGEKKVSDYQETMSNVSFLLGLNPATSNPSDNIAAIYSFAKVMDPGNAVKEAEYKTVEDYAQAVFQKAGLQVKRVFDNSNFLTPEAITNMQATVLGKGVNAQMNYDGLLNQYGDSINRYVGSAMPGFNQGKEYLIDYSSPYRNMSVVVPINGKEYKMTFENYMRFLSTNK